MRPSRSIAHFRRCQNAPMRLCRESNWRIMFPARFCSIFPSTGQPIGLDPQANGFNRELEALTEKTLDPRKEESDAISLRDASPGWVTWASGLLCYSCAQFSPGARGTSHHSVRQSLDELFTVDGCTQERFF